MICDYFFSKEKVNQIIQLKQSAHLNIYYHARVLYWDPPSLTRWEFTKLKKTHGLAKTLVWKGKI